MVEKIVNLCYDVFPEWMTCSLCTEIKPGQVLRNQFQDADCVECRQDQNRGNSDLFYYLLTKSKIACEICKKSISCQRFYYHQKDCEVLNKNIISYLDNFIVDEMTQCFKSIIMPDEQVFVMFRLQEFVKSFVNISNLLRCEEKENRNSTLICKNKNCAKYVLFEKCFHHFVNCEFRIRTCECGFIGKNHEYKHHKQFCYSRARHLNKTIQQKRYQQQNSFLAFMKLQKKEQKIKQKLQRQQQIQIYLAKD
ncbi:hypothetical protein pb186bvf_001668 [Paramecium bursaria]